MMNFPLWARGPQRLGWGAELTHTATPGSGKSPLTGALGWRFIFLGDSHLHPVI